MTKRKDRRASQRFAMRWPVLYRAGSGWKRARLLDMSATGVLAAFPEALPIGAILEVAMDWPGLYHGKPAMSLNLKAVVVRSGSRGTSMRILRHEFREATPAPKVVAAVA